MKRALRISVAVLVASSTGSAVGCAIASGDVTGGAARFDATAPLSTEVPDGGQMTAGHSWSELYSDYFGNPRASCAGNGTCHGDENQAGAQDSNFVCPANDKDDCYTSMTSPLTELISTTHPSESALTNSVLRHASANVGNMPKNPAYAFSDADLARIQAWINDGALNDSPADSGTPSTDGGTDTDASDITDAGDASD
jgi:hypothetical protein